MERYTLSLCWLERWMEACRTRCGSAVRRALADCIELANSVETSPGTDLQVVFPCAALRLHKR